MNTTTTNQQAINLITKAYDINGFLIYPKSKKNQNEAKQLLQLNDFGYELVNGLDTHVALLNIAYPLKSI